MSLAYKISATSTASAPRARRSRRWLWIGGAVISALLVYGAYLGAWRLHTKRLQEIEQSVLYRVGQPTEWGFDYLVNKRGVRTVVSFQVCDVQLRHGLIDPGKPSGADEHDYVTRLGAEHLQWPWGEEPYWPWPTPWVYEEFFRLMDSRDRRPVVIHCAGGRHRTGSMSALFRLEYDRWPVERVLDEMYSFDFGPPVALHEHNLRTFTPRPRPTDTQLESLRKCLALVRNGTSAPDYESFVHDVRISRGNINPQLDEVLSKCLADDRPFALPLAARLIERADDPLVEVSLAHAEAALAREDASIEDWSMAAALVADFGQPEQQLALLRLLSTEQKTKTPTDRYCALVAGVTNRYTANRIPYLSPILDDERRRPEPQASNYRFCDTAAARLSVIVSANFVEDAATPADPSAWQRAVSQARDWFKTHAGEAQLGQLKLPTGPNKVRRAEANDGAFEVRD